MPPLLKFLPVSESLHHAYIVIGEAAVVVPMLKDYLNERFGADYTSTSNPDFWLREYDVWGVEESRDLKEFQSRRPAAHTDKVFVISARQMTLEAQNSLLKTLEEPPAGTHFFLISPAAGNFLPTVLSRCQLLEISGEAVPVSDRSQVFLGANIATRFKIVKDILKEQEDDASVGVKFFNDLLKTYWQKVPSNPDPVLVSGATVLSLAANSVSVRGTSLRLLLEYVASVVPVV